MESSAAVVARELRVVVGRLRRRILALATPSDLTLSQSAVLSRLHKGGPASASDLAAYEGIRPQSMAATLAALAGHGLVQRSPDPQDGRKQVISLTRAGRDLLESDRAVRQEWLTEAVQNRYTDAERAAIADALRLLAKLTA